MVKTNQIKQVQNGEIADADDVNQIVENAGATGGLIPYDETTKLRVTDGSKSLGSSTYPWGSFCVSKDKAFIEIDTTNGSISSQVTWSNLRKIAYMKDLNGGDSSLSGHGGKTITVKDDETGFEYSTPSNIQVFTGNGNFTVPAGITKVYVSMVGGGGGGAGTASGDSANAAGGGGGGGGTCLFVPYTVTPAQVCAVVVGGGGGGGVNADGSAGSASTFDAVLIVPGGAGGLRLTPYTGGAGGAAATRNASANTPGSYSTNAASIAGGTGGTGGAASVSGGGGASHIGNGAAGKTSGGAGTAASANTGGGGGGACNVGSASNLTGGAGGSGLVLVMW